MLRLTGMPQETLGILNRIDLKTNNCNSCIGNQQWTGCEKQRDFPLVHQVHSFILGLPVELKE